MATRKSAKPAQITEITRPIAVSLREQLAAELQAFCEARGLIVCIGKCRFDNASASFDVKLAVGQSSGDPAFDALMAKLGEFKGVWDRSVPFRKDTGLTDQMFGREVPYGKEKLMIAGLRGGTARNCVVLQLLYSDSPSVRDLRFTTPEHAVQLFTASVQSKSRARR